MNTNPTQTTEARQLADEVDDLRTERDAIRAELQGARKGLADTRDLMRAVLDAVDVPLPATGGDETAYYCLMASRAGVVRAALQTALEDAYNVPVMTRHLRDTAGGAQ
ncbi:hypothetical protein GCM10027447_12830 [Glycomyces halotolerans]